MSIVAEWSYLPSTLLDIITDPWTLLILLGGVILGYIIGVIPGLGPTMGMALALSIRGKPTMHWRCCWEFWWLPSQQAALRHV